MADAVSTSVGPEVETETCDVVVIGAGLAGLGVAVPLGRDYGKNVVVLDKVEPNFDGRDRFRKEIGASFKNAGILDLGNPSKLPFTIKEYFATETVRLYRKAGIAVKDEGGFVMSSSVIDTLATDLLLKHVPESELRTLEPHLKLASTNKGVFKYPRGSAAEPELTMKVLSKLAQDNADVRYGVTVDSIRYDAKTSIWTVVTNSGMVLRCDQVVVAAGPGSKALLNKVGIKVHLRDIYGIMKQTKPIGPYLQGVLLGAKSLRQWGMYDFVCQTCCCRETVEATAWFGENCHENRWTTHLYMNHHDRRLYMGGPRIVLPENGSYDSLLDPDLYADDWIDTEHYARTLLSFPPEAKFEESWGGVMVFPTDDDLPIVGSSPKHFNGSLFVSIGWASAGFREAYGAGHFLARCMHEGYEWISKTDNKNLHKYKTVLPRFHSK